MNASQQRKAAKTAPHIADTLDACDWIRLVADAFTVMQEKPDPRCKECDIPIRRGVRCATHYKSHHADLERARARRARKAAVTGPASHAPPVQ